jgi:hypothetical protein
MGGVSSGGLYPTPFAHGTYLSLTHEPRYSFACDVPPWIFQLALDAWTPLSASVCDKNLPNLLHQLNIFLVVSAGRTPAPGIKSAFGHAKNLAHDHHGKFLLVLFNTLIFHLLSREKMLITFLICRAPAELAPVLV